MHFPSLMVFVAATGISARFFAAFPTATPIAGVIETRQISTPEATTSTLSPDPWQCVTENITQYFDVPKPTGSLLDSINSYGEELAKPCKATATGLDYFSCTVSDPKSWCGFETAAPSNVLSAYSSYVTAAVSFWTEKSDTMSILSTRCAAAWARQGPAQQEWLKIATAHAQCHIEAHPATSTSASSSETSTASTVSPPSASTSTTNSINSSATTSTSTSHAASLEGRAVGTLTLMGTGLAILSNVI